MSEGDFPQRPPEKEITQPADFKSSVSELYGKIYQPEKPKWHSRFRFSKTARAERRQVEDKVTHIDEAMGAAFPDPEDRQKVEDSAKNFISKLSGSIDTDERMDGRPYELIGQFMKGFPENVTNISERPNADTVAAMFRIGTNTINQHMAEVDDEPELLRRTMGNRTNGRLGWITEWMGRDLPNVLRKAGDQQYGLVARLEEVSATGDFSDLTAMSKYFESGVYEPNERTREKIHRMIEIVQGIDAATDTSKSPLHDIDGAPWTKETVMGSEKRAPGWKDMADMVRNTESNNIEYGIKVSKDKRDRSTRMEYKRGKHSSVSNKGNNYEQEDMLFFHSHPSIDEKREITASLISDADKEATYGFNYGGGYLNVATVHGVTLHTGILEGHTVSHEGDENAASVYRIESGSEANKTFVPGEIEKPEFREMMQAIHDAQEPFVYSVSDKYVNKRHFFIHIPWDRLDQTVSFEDVCYGDGLEKILDGLENLPDIPHAKNVYEAMSHIQK